MQAVFNTRGHAQPRRLHALLLLSVVGARPAAGLVQGAALSLAAVIDPRGVLAEFGLTLPADTKIRVWDSTAELRYLVVPHAARRQPRA